MNKKLFISISAALTVLVITGVISFIARPVLPKPTPDDSIAESSNEKRYTVKEYGEQIGVFEGDADKEPVQILAVNISGLPEGDVKLLKQGITIYGEAALRRIIEDYTS